MVRPIKPFKPTGLSTIVQSAVPSNLEAVLMSIVGSFGALKLGSRIDVYSWLVQLAHILRSSKHEDLCMEVFACKLNGIAVHILARRITVIIFSISDIQLSCFLFMP